MKKTGLISLAVLMLFCGRAHSQPDSGKLELKVAGGLADSIHSIASDTTLVVSLPSPDVIAVSDTQALREQPSVVPVPAGYSIYILIGASLLGCVVGAAAYRLISGSTRKAGESEFADFDANEPGPAGQPDDSPEYIIAVELNKKLMAENEQLKREKAELGQRLQDAQNGAGISQNDIPREIVFYMPQPSRNGRFQETSKRTDAADALYAFRVQSDNPEIASFEFIAKDAYLNAAIGNEPSWISIACDRTNQPSGTTSRVKTETPGVAYLKDGEWEITRKAKITYL